jgi:5'-3' exonuclease
MEPSKKAEPRTLTQEETQFERETAIARCDTLMRELIHTMQADTYQCFLSGKGNFRYKVNPEYKANRKDTVDPRFRLDCKAFLFQEWNATESVGCEADDLLGIYQTDDSIIATIDKDLLMIPGWHYNWVKDEKTYTTPLDGIRFLYKQMLIGDKADNIFGVNGLGPVKSSKLIDCLETEEEMIQVVFDLYNQDVDRFIVNAQCLWIMQEQGVTWAKRVPCPLPSLLQQGLEVQLGFMTSLNLDTSMELSTNPVMMSGILTNGLIPESMEAKSQPLI